MRTNPDVKSFVGPAGTVEWMPQPEYTGDWRAAGTMDAWLCDCPGQSPAWRYYVLTGVALRDLPGQTKPPKKQFPEATHEILMVALAPDEHPEWEPDMLVKGKTFTHLHPINVCIHINATDEQAQELLTLLAKGVAHGLVPAEPPFPNPHHEPTWTKVINATLEHITLGGHPTGDPN